MSDPDLDTMRRDYKFGLPVEKRCEACRHAAPLDTNLRSLNGGCRLLHIAIHNVRQSNCPGWQTHWGYSR